MTRNEVAYFKIFALNYIKISLLILLHSIYETSFNRTFMLNNHFTHELTLLLPLSTALLEIPTWYYYVKIFLCLQSVAPLFFGDN